MQATLAQVGALFTVPALAAAGAAAVSIPIIIHLLYRMRRRPEPWGAMRFLMLAYRRHRQRLRFEQWLLLATRCLLVLLLGLALAGPVLTGCQGWLGGFDARGRHVHIVMDDAMSVQAEDAVGAVRLDQLRATALAMVDELGASDRVTVWRGGRPAERLVEAETDRSALRSAIEGFEPRYGRPDVPAALAMVSETLSREGVARGSADVVVLSDFSRSGRYLEEATPSALRGLGERADVWAVRPSEGLANVQIASLRPRRSMVLAGEQAGDASVPVTVALRRFGPVLEAGSVDVTLTLMDDDGRALERVTRSQRFAEGQSTATLNMSLPIGDDASPGSSTDAARVLVVHGQVDGGGMTNRLRADDERLAVVEVRRQLRVALVDERDGARDEVGLRPVQWLLLGLSPLEANDGGPVGLSLHPPGAVSSGMLGEHDAVFVLRPDALNDEAWRDLSGFVADGGLAWVLTPAVETTAVWPTAMQRAFELDWRLAMEPDELDAAAAGWTLAERDRAPEALSLLSADWDALLRPVRVYRRLPLVAPEADRWLTVDGDVEGPALLTAHEHGQGTLMLLAAALDSEWTNLPAKPMFVPLLHESLRGVLGEARGRIVPNVVSGDRPTLGPAWRGVEQLTRARAFGPTALPAVDGAEPTRLALQADDEAGLLLRRSADRPGVYAAPADAAALKLAVNVDASAGDTQAVSEEQLARWLSGLGAWQFIDMDDPGAALRREARSLNLGWPLLWVVLALLLLETLLARRFSHAYAGPRGTLAGGLSRVMRVVRPVDGGGNGAVKGERKQKRERDTVGVK
ncbi:BatA domain-containing protein [Phycisphaerales bacterium AB-hyl4]|uniref:BatA domain-containing protein n=1 Tax=Natronomicrosphaera hydrolytica TaxID=3242702 RepID=A0ABV4U7I0_9BACT